MVGCTAISRHRYRRPLLSQHQHATPLIVRGNRTTALARVPLGETSYNEEKSDRTTGAWRAWVATKDPYYPELADLAPKAEEWLTLLQQTVEALRVAMERR